MLILKNSQIINLVNIIIAIICGKSVILSDIASELGDSFSEGTEESKIKRIYRFFTNKVFCAEKVYDIFAYNIFSRYKPVDGKVVLIFDHTTIEGKFLILQFSMRIGKRAIPLWYKTFEYKDKKNKQLKHVIEGLLSVYNMIKRYDFDVIVLADRGFKSTLIFDFIQNKLKWKYCIRCTKDVWVHIDGKRTKLQDLPLLKNRTRNYFNVALTKRKFLCNLSVCRDENSNDTWFLIHNMESESAVKEYKKRFTIEEMFKDFKSGGFNMEGTWTEDLTYVRNLHMIISIAYTWLLILGTACTKDKKNHLLGVIKNIGRKKIRMYSLFRAGLKWFKRCFGESIKKYFLKFDFVLCEY
jgi:hypothetical protein